MKTNTARNCFISVGRALILGLTCFYGQAQAQVTYDGIYQWSPGNFLSLHQDGTNLIASIYFTKDGNFTFPAPAGGGSLPVPQIDVFDLMAGQITGTTATINGTRFNRACNVGYNFTFNANATITVTRTGQSNAAAADAAGIFCSAILGTEATTLTVPKIRFNPNTAPVANAGSAQSVLVGTLVTLDGSASSDANGDALTYVWTLTAKPAGSNASLVSPTSAKPTFTTDLAGSYVASLVVNDGQVNSTVSTVSITAAVMNVPPVANAGTAQTVVAGSMVTLNGSTSYDANNDPLTFAWALTSKPAGSTAALSFATSAKPTFTADIAGTYVASLVVNDGMLSSAATTVSVTAVVPAVAATCSASNFTMAAYNAIQVGMTLTQVNQVMGCQYSPNLTNRTQSYVTFSWSYVNVTTLRVVAVLVYFDPTNNIVTPFYGSTFKASGGF